MRGTVEAISQATGYMSIISSSAAGRRSVRATLLRPLRLLGMVIAALAVLLSLVVPSAVALAPPAAPSVAKVADTATSLELSWPAVTGAKGYRIQYSTSASFSSPKYLPAGTTAAPLTATSAVVPGLSTGTTYYFRVAVVDPGSLKVLSDSYSKAVSAAAAYPYTAPGDLTATSVTKSTMRLNWKAVSGAPGYTVRVYTSSGGAKYYQTTTNSIALSGLKSNTLHYFRAYVSRAGSRLSADSPEDQA